MNASRHTLGLGVMGHIDILEPYRDTTRVCEVD